MRINKRVSAAGVASRREADRMIEDRRVTINGRVAKLGDDAPDGARIEIDGRPLPEAPTPVVIAFHKPVGIITTTANQPDNIMDALYASSKPLPAGRLFPVGRLDVASSGLILFTNDTALADRLMRPDSGTEKEYDVTTDRAVDDETLRALAAGVDILDGVRTRPAAVARIGEDRFSITITEGKNRQIRRMCEAAGHAVRRLVRARIAGVQLGALRTGDWRALTAQELRSLVS